MAYLEIFLAKIPVILVSADMVGDSGGNISYKVEHEESSYSVSVIFWVI